MVRSIHPITEEAPAPARNTAATAGPILVLVGVAVMGWGAYLIHPGLMLVLVGGLLAATGNAAANAKPDA